MASTRSSASAVTDRMPTMLPGIGLFGTGAITNVLVQLLREKGFEIKAIWGRTIKEAEEVAISQKIGFYTNKIDDVLLCKDVDLVFIVCQPFLHAEISVKALGIGKHVVCDKPMGLTADDAAKMVRAALYYPSLISLVNYSLRFLPAITHMRRCLHEELIGPLSEISLVDIRVNMGSLCLFSEKFHWMCDAAMGGGVLNFVGSHVVDLVSFLLQQQAVRVHGIVKSYTKSTNSINGIRQISAPDFCNFQMELKQGTLVTVALHSHSVPNKAFSQEILICGSKGHLVVRGGDLFVYKTKPEGQLKEEAVFVDVQDLHFSTSESLLPRPYIKGLCKMVGALKESFAGKEATWVKQPVQAAATFEDGLYVQAVLEAVRKSSELKSWQRVQIISDSPSNHEQIMRFARMSTM